MEDTAVNMAHRYANHAEECMENNQWEQAVDMHFQAAEHFLLATKDTQNQEVIRTLKLMNANHMRQAKDLQRRITKAAAAQAAAIAAAEAIAAATLVPQQKQTSARTKLDSGGLNSDVHSAAVTSTPSAAGGSGRRRGSEGHQQRRSERQQQRHLDPLFQKTLGDHGHESLSRGGDAGSGGSYLGTSSEASSNSSSAMIEESFTLIKNHVKDESDPFNKFWDAVENLVLKISSPVAFTSIPLDGDDPLNSASGLLNSPTSEDPPLLSPLEAPFSIAGVDTHRMLEGNLKVPRHFPSNSSQSLPRPTKPRVDPSPMQESFFIIDSPSSKNASQSKNPSSRSRSTSASESSTHSSSSPYKPTSSGLRKGDLVPRNATKTLEEYAIENQQLKLTLDKLSRRNLKLEKHLEGVMQMSVWTKDVQRSAMQLIKSQDILRPVKQSIQDLSADKGGASAQRAQALALPATSTPVTPSNMASYDQMNPVTMRGRLAELEEEVQKLRLENAKQNSLMKKYKQRWEDLKESAKRRRNAPMAANDDHAGAGAGDDPPGSRGHHIPTEESRGHYRPLHQGASSSSSGTGSYSHSHSLLSTPSSDNNTGSPRPLAALARSSSASGPVLSAGGSYQKRILMESKAVSMLDSTPLNVQHHRQASPGGTRSSTSPRMLDPSFTKAHGSSSPEEGSPSAVSKSAAESTSPASKDHSTMTADSTPAMATGALNEEKGSGVGVINAQVVSAAEGNSASPLSSSLSGSSQKSAASAPSPSDSSLSPALNS
ncbi:hypothetical protein BGZ70_009482 [Mortierella alpina]|uniref:MIT domain-containing protein n=1 Tax=Mortierella alpina TaxID=64518 RepID=A0A9P6J165_MORAP|nr:hypothetical protein BGZ70_009482 [Mortierella alpina]